MENEALTELLRDPSRYIIFPAPENPLKLDDVVRQDLIDACNYSQLTLTHIVDVLKQGTLAVKWNDSTKSYEPDHATRLASLKLFARLFVNTRSKRPEKPQIVKEEPPPIRKSALSELSDAELDALIAVGAK